MMPIANMSPLAVSAIAVASVALVALLTALLMCRSYCLRIRSLQDQNKSRASQTRDLQQQLDEESRRSEWYASLFDHAEAMVFVCSIDDEGLPKSLIEVNQVACRELGYDRDQLLALSPLDIEAIDVPVVAPGYSRTDLVVLSDDYVKKQRDRAATQTFRQRIHRVLADGHHVYETVYRTRAGDSFHVEVDLHRTEFAGQVLLIQSARNIERAREAEVALRNSQRAFRDYFANSPIGIVMYNAERKLMEINAACLRMFGIPTREEFLRFNLLDNEFIPEDDREKIAKGESVRFEMNVNFDVVLRKALFVSSRSGQAQFDVLFNCAGSEAEHGSRIFFVQILDVTEQRHAEAELRERDQQLRQAEKMEALGGIAGGIAHDFNNILTPLLGYAKMILNAHPETETTHEHAARILKAAHRAKDLVSQILTFSRKSDDEDEKQLRPTHVIPIVKEVLTLQRTSQPETVEIKRVLKTERDVVLANPTKIHQILMNLCTNAGHAMRTTNGGVLEVTVSDFLLDSKARSRHRDLQPGRYLQISVSDTGSGIEPAVLSRMFEPFFTTKNKGEGTGMGLAVVHGVVKSYRGTIRVDTQVGKGTTFHVLLPISDQASEQGPALRTDLPSGTESIMVVDDDPDTLEAEKQMLVHLGYKPTCVTRTPEALQTFQKDPSAFDLILTAYTLPGATGMALAKSCRNTRPDLPIIVCIEQNENFPVEKAKEMGLTTFVSKPIEMDALADSLRMELDRAKARAKGSNANTKSETAPA